jgi:hypothetical protein
MEEMGLKAMKIFLDYYKNMKSVLGVRGILILVGTYKRFS